jgi:hypothetical protein
VIDPQLLARVRARRHQGGAILFIVAMTLALLGALGVYALGAATSEIKTSGYARQAAQTHYISEYGTIAMLDAFSPANASYFDAQMLLSPATMNCKSAVKAGSSEVTAIAQRCAKVPQEYFTTAWKGASGTGAAVTRPDSLSPGVSTATPRFTSELTDPITGGFQPGFDVNNGKCFRRYTITTYGQLQNNAANDATTLTLGREIGRARVTTGPFDCGG